MVLRIAVSTDTQKFCGFVLNFDLRRTGIEDVSYKFEKSKNRVCSKLLERFSKILEAGRTKIEYSRRLNVFNLQKMKRK